MITLGRKLIAPIELITFSDDFNRANQDLDVSFNWTTLYQLNSGIHELVSNQVRIGPLVSGDEAALTCYTGETLGRAQYAELEFISQSGGGGWNFGVNVLCTAGSTNFTGYEMRFTSAGTFILYRFNDGSVTLLDSQSGSMSANDVMRLEVDNSGNLQGYKNGSSTGMPSATDTTYTTGAPGIKGYTATAGSTVTIDNVEMGELA